MCEYLSGCLTFYISFTHQLYPKPRKCGSKDEQTERGEGQGSDQIDTSDERKRVPVFRTDTGLLWQQQDVDISSKSSPDIPVPCSRIATPRSTCRWSMARNRRLHRLRLNNFQDGKDTRQLWHGHILAQYICIRSIQRPSRWFRSQYKQIQYFSPSHSFWAGADYF